MSSSLEMAAAAMVAIGRPAGDDDVGGWKLTVGFLAGDVGGWKLTIGFLTGDIGGWKLHCWVLTDNEDSVARNGHSEGGRGPFAWRQVIYYWAS